MTTTERPPADIPPPEERNAAEVNPEHFYIKPGEPWPADVPKDQDLGWWRFRGNPRAARRAEIKIVACWAITMLASLGLMIVYIVGGQPQAEGALLFFAFVPLGLGLVLWARDLLPGHEVTAKRDHQGGSGALSRTGAVVSLSRGTEAMARRPFLYRLLGLVGGLFGLAILFPIASLGDRPHRTLYKTAWTPGARVVDQDGRPIRPEDIQVDGILTGFPEGHIEAPQASVMLINVGGASFQSGKDWNVGSVVAYSKICTHAGCPVGLYNSKSHQLVCPCHQSTFDVLLECKPVFGPAPRPLPQLPLAVNGDGYLIAQSDFHQPVGPGFWNRG